MIFCLCEIPDLYIYVHYQRIHSMVHIHTSAHSYLGYWSSMALRLAIFILFNRLFDHPAVKVGAYLDNLTTLIEANTPRISVVEFETYQTSTLTVRWETNALRLTIQALSISHKLHSRPLLVPASNNIPHHKPNPRLLHNLAQTRKRLLLKVLQVGVPTSARMRSHYGPIDIRT